MAVIKPLGCRHYDLSALAQWLKEARLLVGRARFLEVSRVSENRELMKVRLTLAQGILGKQTPTGVFC